MDDCSICCETMNNTGRKAIKCPYCEMEVCMACFKTYLVGLVTPVPECMSCHKQLSLDFVAEVTPKMFHNKEYRIVRANILKSQERSLLPGTQHLVEERKATIKREGMIDELVDEQKYLRARLAEIQLSIRDLRYNTVTQVGTEPAEKKKFIMGCPMGDCRGFLSQAWKCGTCDRYVCSKCRAVKNGRDDEDHVCNPDDVATTALLKDETKPCPKCAVPIFKISGCPQMWCPECHTTFSWTTGKIETGVVHNPHFYQWQRDQNGGVAPRVPGDVPCGGQCGEMPWNRIVHDIMARRDVEFHNWHNCHRLVAHIRGVTMNQYPLQIGQNDNSDLRVKFLMNEMSEAVWLRHLALRQKRAEKNHSVHQILELVAVSLRDIFTRFVDAKGAIDIVAETEGLRQYANREFQKVQLNYANKTPFITHTWHI